MATHTAGPGFPHIQDTYYEHRDGIPEILNIELGNRAAFDLYHHDSMLIDIANGEWS